MVESVTEQLNEVKSDFRSTTSRSSVMIWMDLFALNLSSSARESVPDALAIMEEVQSACDKGVVLALDSKMVALTRTWCLFELSSSLRFLGKTCVHVALPGKGEIGLEFQIVSKLWGFFH